MIKRSALFIPVLCLLVVSAYAQTPATRTITNFDLEKYKQQRIQAEKDLNENYQRMGFDSPEERSRKLEAWKKENQDLADKWERERIAQETADAVAAQAASQPVYTTQSVYPAYDNDLYTYPGYYYNGRYYVRPPRPGRYIGYYAGGAFWPAPTPARQPLLIQRPVPSQPRPPQNRPERPRPRQ